MHFMTSRFLLGLPFRLPVNSLLPSYSRHRPDPRSVTLTIIIITGYYPDSFKDHYLTDSLQDYYRRHGEIRRMAGSKSHRLRSELVPGLPDIKVMSIFSIFVPQPCGGQVLLEIRN